MMVAALNEGGFKFSAPEGAYYILADFSELSDLRGTEFALWLAKEVGVATVPGTSFYHEPAMGETLTRFAFCKKNGDSSARERAANLSAWATTFSRRRSSRISWWLFFGLCFGEPSDSTP